MPLLSRNHRQVLAARAIDGKRTQYRIDGVAGLVLTHDHADHRGYLTVFVSEGCLGAIHGTAATAALCRLLLPHAD